MKTYKKTITYQGPKDAVIVWAGLLGDGLFASQWGYLLVLLVREWEWWWI